MTEINSVLDDAFDEFLDTKQSSKTMRQLVDRMEDSRVITNLLRSAFVSGALWGTQETIRPSREYRNSDYSDFYD
jgi:hypothetical protein